jgi:putative FmdB family regulatory protein
MPLFEYLCLDCGQVSEILVMGQSDEAECTGCGSRNVRKLISASSSASGLAGGKGLPGAGDTACCGSAPGKASGCAGPGSCCGRAH